MVRSLDLHELIGATLISIVRADTEAAKATLDFIKTVGFIPSEAEEETAEVDQTTIEAGQLRMAEFRYQKLDENNETSQFVASVPILSLVPIPGLQIKEAKLAFSAKISDIIPESRQSRAKTTEAAAETSKLLLRRIKPVSHRILAQPVAASGTKNQEVKGAFHLDLEVSLQQADTPLGVEKILVLMDQAIRDRQDTESESDNSPS